MNASVINTSTSDSRATTPASSPRMMSHGIPRRVRTGRSRVAEKVPAKATCSMAIVPPGCIFQVTRRQINYLEGNADDEQPGGCVSSPQLSLSWRCAMPTNGSTEARKLRSRLNHPIIDADGHWLEYGPVMREEFRRIGGDAAVEALATATDRVPSSLRMSLPERRRRRVGMEAFWSSPSENVLDRATAMLPRLMYERLDDLGIDFCVVYPTAGLGFHRMQDTRLRRAICRAYNVFTADQFRGLEDRVIPAAIIPMYTPEEAIEELEFASRQLGYRVMMVGGLMRRRVPAVAEEQPDAARFAEWYDVIGIDSDYDYDPVWEKCRALRVAPSFHNGARSILLRNSPSNFCYNHIGHFASAGHAVAKALFFGGVTRRFPDLNFAFLEGGVGWACMLYADLIGHWDKRNRQSIESTNPNKLDLAALLGYTQKYGRDAMVDAVRRGEGLEGDSNSKLTGGLEDLDDYFRCKVARKEDLRDLFVPRFYFGCEADDPVNAWAFNRRANPMGARLNALFSSDIGHFDVPDMTEVVPEAYELVEHELITADDFRDFMFTNAVRFWGEVNPDFFKGTAVEKAAAEALARPVGAPAVR
ncbi:MAG: amidohydrolase [Candidatus Rokuibacteriota bacterium]|nr:MAG: amidohydrolase [Candidatus Rokubacteria bacterium]